MRTLSLACHAENKKVRSPRVDAVDGIADGLLRRDHCGKRQQQNCREHVEPRHEAVVLYFAHLN